MGITAEHIAQFAVLLIAAATFYKTWRSESSTARKDQLAQAEARIAEQNTRIDRLEKKLDREIYYRVKLMGYIGELQRIMRQAGLVVPPEPLFEDEHTDSDGK